MGSKRYIFRHLRCMAISAEEKNLRRLLDAIERNDVNVDVVFEQTREIAGNIRRLSWAA